MATVVETVLCPIAWQSCYTLVTFGISFNFLCSKSEHLSFMLLHTSEFLCYPCDKQQWSVSLEEDLVLCYWQGCDSEGPCVPYKRCWCSRQTWCLCYGNALCWCLSNPCVCWDSFGRNLWPLSKWYLEKARQDTTEIAHHTRIVSLGWHLGTPVACSKVYRGVLVHKGFMPIALLLCKRCGFWRRDFGTWDGYTG